MTWVIGASTIFGYGLVLSDICVTDQTTGKSKDVLQKAYPIGKWIVAGLAGDVRIGLTLLRSLQLYYDEMNPGPDECCQPEWVATEWSKRARRIYTDVANDHDVGECHILTVGLQPTCEGTLGNAKVHVSVYRSPEFIPESIAGGNAVRSIGSGLHIERYRNAIEHLLTDPDLVYMKAEIGSPGGFGHIIGSMLQREVSLHPEKGISSHFQLFKIRLGSIERWDSPKMPEVARGWPELLEKIEGNMNSNALVGSCL